MDTRIKKLVLRAQKAEITEYYIYKTLSDESLEFNKEDYKGVGVHLEFTCKKCGFKFQMTPTNILRPKAEYMCSRCNNKMKDLRDYKTRCLEASNQKILPFYRFYKYMF